MDRDILFAVKNNFYIGAFNNAINEASDLQGLGEAEAVERDVFVYRSYIALGSYDLVISEIPDSASTSLLAIKLLAQYSGKRVTPEAATAMAAEWLADAACNRNPYVRLAAGLIYAAEGNEVEALKAANAGGPLSLELMALCVQVYLEMNRVDKAEQQVKAMSAVDDDATVTQLATAWVGVQLGGAKVQEASYIYQELGDKHAWTPKLHAGLAVCRMKMGEWEDAERDLLDALGKSAQDADTLANLITVALHLGKPTARYAAQLKALAPGHPATARYDAAEELFARAAAAAAVS
ncbi:MAG: epsilon-COP [Monoraphidium minutum]|nr:MAG: epsilon-COP [Monoraphidium minutum]